jgi:hypothetical protein
MITHYVRISNALNYADIVIAACDLPAEPAGVSEGWVAVEDAKDHADACVRAREYVYALEMLEEPKLDLAGGYGGRNIPGRARGY